MKKTFSSKEVKEQLESLMIFCKEQGDDTGLDAWKRDCAVLEIAIRAINLLEEQVNLAESLPEPEPTKVENITFRTSPHDGVEVWNYDDYRDLAKNRFRDTEVPEDIAQVSNVVINHIPFDRLEGCSFSELCVFLKFLSEGRFDGWGESITPTYG